MPNQILFAQRLQEAIDALRMDPSETDNHLAQRIGIDDNRIYYWPDPEGQKPELDSLCRLAHAAYPDNLQKRLKVYEHSEYAERLSGRERPSTVAHAIDQALFAFCESHTPPGVFLVIPAPVLLKETDHTTRINNWRRGSTNPQSDSLGSFISHIREHWGEHGPRTKEDAEALLGQVVDLWPGPSSPRDPYYEFPVDRVKAAVLAGETPTPYYTSSQPKSQRRAGGDFEIDSTGEPELSPAAAPPPRKVAEMTAEDAGNKLYSQARFTQEEIMGIAKALYPHANEGAPVTDAVMEGFERKLEVLTRRWNGTTNPKVTLEAENGQVTAIIPSDVAMLPGGEGIANISRDLLVHVVLPHMDVELRPPDAQGKPLGGNVFLQEDPQPNRSPEAQENRDRDAGPSPG